jgi:hypothetical protein
LLKGGTRDFQRGIKPDLLSKPFPKLSSLWKREAGRDFRGYLFKKLMIQNFKRKGTFPRICIFHFAIFNESERLFSILRPETWILKPSSP